jgi:murein DD-endopeptidase MepM/ murein hydrolase activator NlpD
MPVQGVAAKSLVDNFDEGRGSHKHEAIDILAPRGTPVVAVDDGRIARLFRSAAGGITVYQFDRDEKFVYYYAHLDRYASGLTEGAMLKRGEPLGAVGTTGNAPKNTPHLHFTIFRMGPEKRWWKGTAINPYPFLTTSQATIPGG